MIRRLDFFKGIIRAVLRATGINAVSREQFNRSHSHFTRFSAVGNFHVQGFRTNRQLLSFSRTGTRIWNKIPPKLSKLSETLFNGNY